MYSKRIFVFSLIVLIIVQNLVINVKGSDADFIVDEITIGGTQENNSQTVQDPEQSVKQTAPVSEPGTTSNGDSKQTPEQKLKQTEKQPNKKTKGIPKEEGKQVTEDEKNPRRELESVNTAENKASLFRTPNDRDFKENSISISSNESTNEDAKSGERSEENESSNRWENGDMDLGDINQIEEKENNSNNKDWKSKEEVVDNEKFNTWLFLLIIPICIFLIGLFRLIKRIWIHYGKL